MGIDDPAVNRHYCRSTSSGGIEIVTSYRGSEHPDKCSQLNHDSPAPRRGKAGGIEKSTHIFYRLHVAPWARYDLIGDIPGGRPQRRPDLFRGDVNSILAKKVSEQFDRALATKRREGTPFQADEVRRLMTSSSRQTVEHCIKLARAAQTTDELCEQLAILIREPQAVSRG